LSVGSAEPSRPLSFAPPWSKRRSRSARIGQKNGLVRQWARRGTRPRQPADQRYDNAYLFGAICPARGVGAQPASQVSMSPTEFPYESLCGEVWGSQACTSAGQRLRAACTRSFSNRMPVRSSLSRQRRGVWPTTQPRDPRRLRCPDPRHYLTHVAALASMIYRKPRSRGLGARELRA
jgi:hypothetical protein